MSIHVVGATEIVALAAERGLIVRRETVNQWNYRRKAWIDAGRPQRRQGEECMPDPIGTVSGQPAWDWGDIHAWMVRTGKVKQEES